MGFLSFFILWNFTENDSKTSNLFSNETENWILESLFILFPFLIVLLLVYPSFSLLYSINEIHEPEVIVKIIGNQWFWSYEVYNFPLSAIPINTK